MTDTAILPRMRYAVAPLIQARQFDHEWVIVDLDAGVYFGLDPVGGLIWQYLAEGRSVAESSARVAQQFDVEPLVALSDALELVRLLLEKRLILPRADDP